jgi:tyrosinase
MANISHSPNGMLILLMYVMIFTGVIYPDPLFLLLHTQLDRVWAAWQSHNHLNLNAIAGGVDQDLQNSDAHPLGTGTPVTKDTILFLSNLGPNAKVSDVFDTTGGYLCYKYAT